jgi:hypothetical protein
MVTDSQTLCLLGVLGVLIAKTDCHGNVLLRQ